MSTSVFRRHRSLFLVLAVVALVALWVFSGQWNREPVEPPRAAEARPVTVGVTLSRAEQVERLVVAQGEVLPEQVVTVRAKTDGQIVETPLSEGALVEENAVIARLDMDDRDARRRQALAAVRGAQSDFEAARQLATEGFQSRLRVDAATAELEAARAQLEAIELDIRHTSIRAPIHGVLNRQIARRGDFVTTGEAVAEIIENNPLRAVVQIPQHRVQEVRAGQRARVSFLDGTVREGEVTFVAAQADRRTRTFRAEVRLENPDRALPSGISVTVEIPVREVRAHRISPALITQGESGELGVKIVETGEDGQDRARLVTVTPVRADANRLWVTGLDDETRLITLGQGFVSDGDPVRVHRAGDEAGS